MEVTSSRTDVGIASPPPVIDSLWFDGLHQTALSCFTQSRVEMECIAKDVGASNVPWTISSTATILTSDADAQRKVILDYITNTNGMKPLLELLESSSHTKVGEKTVKIIRELVSPKSGKHRTAILKQCLDVNYLAVAVSVLKQLLKGSGFSGTIATASSSTASPVTISLEDFSGTGSSSSSSAFRGGTCNNTIATLDDLGNGMQTTMDLLWFLSSAVAKDSQFPDKVRQMLKVKFFHDVFKKVFFAKSATHFPLLKIMRQLSKCRNTAEILGKDKVMHTVKKCFAVLNSQPHAKLLILFEWLALLTRDRKNCIRFLKAGMLVKVLNCFRHWTHWKGKGLLKLSKSVISIYTHLARTKSGKKSLVQTDAINMIRSFCESCPQERSFDDVIMRACAMIHVCYGKETLPLERLECPIKFEVPRTSDILSNSPLLLADSGSSSDEDDPEAEGDDEEDSDSDNESESDNSVVDEEEDDQDQAVGPVLLENRRSSRKGSLVRNDSSSEVESEMMSLDRIAKFSYFFREFSSQYSAEGEKKSGMSIVNKLEQSSGDCIIEEYEEKWTDLRSDDNGNNLEEASAGTSNNIPLALSFPTSAHKYSWTSRHGAKLPRMESLRKLYFRIANKTSHVSPFVKIAYPDICFGLSGKQVENLCAITDRTVLRKNMFNCIAKAVAETVSFRSKVVYSLDELIGKESMSDSQLLGKSSKLTLANNDEGDAGRFESKSPLSFESRFESGNLRKAVQTGEFEYELFLTSDINSSRHNQWFYFQVGNMSDEASYTFNIVNCIKTNSLFNYGMQPVVFSVMDAMKHKPGWVRSGSQLCYYKNGYKFTGKKSTRTYHTLSFTLTFANKGDIVYIAYYIPYTYTRLMVELHNLLSTVKHSDKVHCRYDVLCKSLDHNDIPLLTITAPIGGNHTKMQDRDVVFITSRVHPGETNASWVMMGILRKLLLGNNVEDLLQRHVFKIVPMLNAEGVINGCHRSGLTSQDLNRCWMNPHEILHPSIYNTKMLVAYCCRVRGKEPSVFLDLHGHSRRKNAFFYGCSFARSWRQEDRITPENPQKLYALAESMSVHCPYFVMHFCHYDVRKSRETTARVAIWREYGITRSFTLECSYCGCDRGPSKGVSFGTSQLWEIGEALCESIATMECKIQSQQKLDEIDVPEAVIESFIE